MGRINMFIDEKKKKTEEEEAAAAPPKRTGCWQRQRFLAGERSRLTALWLKEGD